MSRTRRKLDEACFFLNHLQDAEKKHPEFDYFLNAFVAASRSVSWIMKAEYGKVFGWREWYEAQVPQEGEEDLLASFTKLRNRSQKEDPLESELIVVMEFPPDSLTPEFKELIGRDVGKRFEMSLYAVPENGDISNIPANAVLGTMNAAELRLDELGEQNILDACNKYFTVLDRLVDCCEAGFAV
jgi:hypothetical protein